MLIKCENDDDKIKQGVYMILNNVNNKVYVGSTTLSFIKRFHHHFCCLNNNKHKNTHLQNSWNKYGSDNFEFVIYKICKKEDCLREEQIYINQHNSFLRKFGYNINPNATGTPNMCKESIEKRRQTMLRKYKSGELDHIKNILRSHTPWNKGKKYDSTDHLKVPKNKKGDRSSFKESTRSSLPEVIVYDLNMNFVGKWRSAKDLEEWSMINGNTLPIISRFSTERMGKPVHYLSSGNINKSFKENKPYKGLYFVLNVPLSGENQIEKEGKNGEG